MKKFAFLVSIIALSVSFAFAQTTGGIKGQVRSADGDGISNVEVTARKDGVDLKSVNSDRKGKFVLQGLKPGVYNITFRRTGYSLGLKANVEIKEDNIRDLGDNLVLEVDKGTQVIVNGSVFNQDGLVISGAKIKIERVLENGKTKKMGRGFSSRQGEFTFRFPDESATFRITASARGKEDIKDIEVESAGVYRLSLTLNLEKK